MGKHIQLITFVYEIRIQVFNLVCTMTFRIRKYRDDGDRDKLAEVCFMTIEVKMHGLVKQIFGNVPKL